MITHQPIHDIVSVVCIWTIHWASRSYRHSANCHCAVEGAQGHGPYWLLTWPDRDSGKSRGRTVPADAIEGTRAQIAEYQRLRGLVRVLVEVSGRICDARLDADKPAEPGKRWGLDAALAEEIEAEVERLIGAGVVDDFQAIEIEARRVALQIMGHAVARILNADRSDDRGPHLSCECGGEARFAGRRPKAFTTALGPLTLERAWYHCDSLPQRLQPA